MARLITPRNLTLIGVGLVACIALAPYTNWSFRNDLDLARSGLTSGPAFSTLAENPWNSPRAMTILDPALLEPKTQEEQFVQALGYAEWGMNRQPWEEEWGAVLVKRQEPLDAYCTKYPKDAIALAQFVRLISQQALYLRQPDLKAPNGVTRAQEKTLPQRRRVTQYALELAKRGESLEPDNAFWTIMRGGWSEALGNHADSLTCLRRASEMKRYEEYALEGAVLTRKSIERRWGYRGEAVRILLAAGILFPHYINEKNWMRICCLSEGDSESGLLRRWQAYQAGYLLSRESNTLIGQLVGRGSMVAAAKGPAFEGQPTRVISEAEKSGQLFRSFQMELARGAVDTNGLSPEAMADDTARLKQAGQKVMAGGEGGVIDDSFMMGSIVSALGLISLIASLVACILFGLWVWRAPSRFDRSRVALGLALIVTSVLWTKIHVQPDGSSLFGQEAALWFLLMALLYSLRAGIEMFGTSDKFHKGANVVCLLAGLSALAVVEFPFSLLLAGANSVSLLFFWKKGKRLGPTLAMIVLAALSVGLVASLPRGVHPGHHFMFSLFMAGALFCAFPAEKRKLAASVVFAVGCLGYFGTTAYGVNINSWLKPFYVDFMSEGHRARVEANLPRLSTGKP